MVVFKCFLPCVPSLSPSTSLLAPRGPDAVPSEDYSRWPPCAAGFFVKGDSPRTHAHLEKKHYENKHKFSFKFRFGFGALEPDRTAH
jgi:hypothetical protein